MKEVAGMLVDVELAKVLAAARAYARRDGGIFAGSIVQACAEVEARGVGELTPLSAPDGDGWWWRSGERGKLGHPVFVHGTHASIVSVNSGDHTVTSRIVPTRELSGLWWRLCRSTPQKPPAPIPITHGTVKLTQGGQGLNHGLFLQPGGRIVEVRSRVGLSEMLELSGDICVCHVEPPA